MLPPRKGRFITLWAAALTVAIGAYASRVSADSADSRDLALVKAGYVLKIPLFIEWPAAQWKSANDPLVIGVLGDSQMLKYLLEVATSSQKAIGQRPIEIKEYTSETYQSAATPPDVLFITGKLCESAKDLLRPRGNKSVMSVSDCGDFIRLGGMFRILKQGSHIALEANRAEVEHAGLLMSFRLATVTKIVTPETSEK